MRALHSFALAALMAISFVPAVHGADDEAGTVQAAPAQDAEASAAQRDDSGGPAESPSPWSSQLQLYFYGGPYARSASIINPGNDIAHLPNDAYTGEIRLDLSYKGPWFTLTAKPRGQWEEAWAAGSIHQTFQAWINEWAIRKSISHALSISAGREIMTWGPSNFRSPSNPFYFDNGRENPILELRGVDFVRVSYASTTAWSISAVGVLGNGHGPAPPDGFHRTAMLKLDYTGGAWNFSINASKPSARPLFVGGYAQATVGKGWLVYGEAGAHQGSTAWYPAAVEPASYGAYYAPFTQRYLNSGHIFYSALAGQGYTFSSSHTLYTEYLHQNAGYSGVDAQRFGLLASSSNALLSSGTPQAGLGAMALGQALNTGLPLLRRDYLFFQFQNNQAGNGPIWQIRNTLGINDGSGQIAVYGEWNVAKRVTLFGLVGLNYGSPRTEFGELLRANATIGLKIFGW
jgi:hypothetical protein